MLGSSSQEQIIAATEKNEKYITYKVIDVVWNAKIFGGSERKFVFTFKKGITFLTFKCESQYNLLLCKINLLLFRTISVFCPIIQVFLRINAVFAGCSCFLYSCLYYDKLTNISSNLITINIIFLRSVRIYWQGKNLLKLPESKIYLNIIVVCHLLCIISMFSLQRIEM